MLRTTSHQRMESKIEGLLSPEGAGGGHEYPREFRTLGRDTLVATRSQEAGAAAHVRRFQSLRDLDLRLQREPALPLRALIFHCSRCGSTLLAQLLALEGSIRVFSEPPVLNEFLWSRTAQLEPDEMHRALRTFVRAFGFSPAEGERGLAIKLSSTALLFLPALRVCFPDVPFVYLLRKPGEVVTSINANPPFFLRGKSRHVLARAWGGDPALAEQLSAADWHAWYVERNLRLALQHANEFSDVIDHEQSGTRFLEWVNRLTLAELPLHRPDIARLLAHHSKAPHRTYQPDSAWNADLAANATPVADEIYQLWRGRLTHGSQP